MSEIFGVLDSKRSTQIELLLTKMGTRMAHREWCVVETYAAESLGGLILFGAVGRQEIALLKGAFSRTTVGALEEGRC
jgi:hypothetical protein